MSRHRRSMVKTFTFRILATILTVALVWWFTGSLEIAGTIGALDFVSKLALYYFHDRAWLKIKWGKK